VLPGLLGLVWLFIWRKSYRRPEEHPRLSAEEREMILADSSDGDRSVDRPHPGWFDLLKLPQTWGVIVARAFTDPVWYFIADWFPIYLVAKGISLKSGLIAIWIPFIAADLGNGGSIRISNQESGPPGQLAGALSFRRHRCNTLIPTILTVNLTGSPYSLLATLLHGIFDDR
jgi:ACS family hexuronate transporter-like MFS transporter